MDEEFELTQDIVRELLDYDPETGLLFWKRRNVRWFRDGKKTAEQAMNTWNAQNAGKRAFTDQNKDGYLRGSIKVKGKAIKTTAHRIIYLWYHGVMPDVIDHKNHIRNDNKILNLTNTDTTGNSRNLSKTKKNTSGFVGVSERKIGGRSNGKWRSFVTIKRKTIFLGESSSIEEAIEKRNIALREYNFHANHGK